MATAKQIILTSEGLEKLELELEDLKPSNAESVRRK